MKSSVSKEALLQIKHVEGIVPALSSLRCCCESAALNMPANLENSALAAGLEKFSFHSNPTKESSKYCITVLIPPASNLMLKILRARSTINEPRDSR